LVSEGDFDLVDPLGHAPAQGRGGVVGLEVDDLTVQTTFQVSELGFDLGDASCRRRDRGVVIGRGQGLVPVRDAVRTGTSPTGIYAKICQIPTRLL